MAYRLTYLGTFCNIAMSILMRGLTSRWYLKSDMLTLTLTCCSKAIKLDEKN